MTVELREVDRFQRCREERSRLGNRSDMRDEGQGEGGSGDS